MHYLIITALYILAIGLMNSISLMAAFHILIAPPILYFCWKKGLKNLPKSTYAMLAFCIVLVLSVLFNQEVIGNGYKNIGKVKYYLIGVLSIVPLKWYFTEYLDTSEKRIKIIKPLLCTFLVACTLASISGLIGFYTGFNPLKFKTVDTYRAKGMFGMIMTYGHQAALLGVILIGMIKHRDKFKNLVPTWLIYSCTFFTLFGLLMSYTRGALLAFVAGAIFINKKVAMVSIVTIGLVAGVISIAKPEFVKQEIIRKGSNDKRMSFWKGAVYAFKERPLFGYGFKNYQAHSIEIKKRNGVSQARFPGHAHNNFLQMLATTGLLGLALTVAWLVFWLMEVIKINNYLSEIFFVSIVAFITGGLTQATIIDGENLFMIFIIYALSQIVPKDEVATI